MIRKVLALLLTSLYPALALGADQRDGPAQQADPAADLGDLYAWTSGDASKVYLVLTTYPGALPGARFSEKVYYVFHTTSRATLAAGNAVPVDVICSFDARQRVSCWVGADPTGYVSGDASSPNGLRSQSGKVRVFTGLRREPFFFNEEGFKTAAARIKASYPALTLDLAGCPALTPAAAAALREALAKDPRGMAPRDAYAGARALALVLEIDKALLTRGGPILAVWAATRPRS